jgi:hypothetical protein
MMDQVETVNFAVYREYENCSPCSENLRDEGVGLFRCSLSFLLRLISSSVQETVINFTLMTLLLDDRLEDGFCVCEERTACLCI